MNKDLTKYAATKKKSEQSVLIGGIAAIIGAISFFTVPNQIGLILGAVLFIIGIIFAVMGSVKFNKLSTNFKVDVVTELVTSFVDEGKFDPHQGLPQGVVYATEFLKRADRFHSEDFLSGSMDGVQFISSDVKLEERHVERTENGTREYYETYFLGRIFRFEFNKSFEGYLQVLEKGRPVVKRKFNKVKLESVVFNKKFKTFATSEHSAFYVLTPHFMEALMNFEKNNKGNISFSFIDNHLFIGINNFKDTFELKMFRKLDESVFEEFKRDLFVIKEVVSELRLNNNIFKKE